MIGTRVTRFVVRHAMHIAFVLMCILFAVLTTDDRVGFPGRFGSPENLLNILNQNLRIAIW